jgi:hypothetical protein
MDTPNREEARVSSTAYIWTVPGKAISVHLEWTVIERMLPEIMRGFGSVPRRGAEVGGILLGRVEAGQPLTLHVNGFETVRCEHEQGPSFILSVRDRERWLQAFERTRFEPGRDTYAVGYYRSHTRDGLSLAAEDLTIMAEFFPAPHEVALLVKPFASRTSQAGFFIYEEGSIRADASHLEFPFRPRPAVRSAQPEFVPERRERPLFAEVQPQTAVRPQAEEPPVRESGGATGETERRDSQSDSRVPLPAITGPDPARYDRRKQWKWAAPVVALFLVLGALLAIQFVTGGPSSWFRMRDPYALGLSFTTAADNLHLSWNREAPIIRSASRGILTITDGGTSRRVELGQGQLQNGSVVYRRLSNDVVVKLEVFANDRNSVAEILELQLAAEPVPAQGLQQVSPPPQP